MYTLYGAHKGSVVPNCTISHMFCFLTDTFFYFFFFFKTTNCKQLAETVQTIKDTYSMMGLLQKYAIQNIQSVSEGDAMATSMYKK